MGRGGPSRWRHWRMAGALLWAGVWTAGGVASAIDPTDATGPVPAILFGLAFGVLPVLPLVTRWIREEREVRAARRADQGQRRALADHRRAQARLDRLPERQREDWQRLDRAHELVGRFAEDGWIASASLSEVGALVEQLEALAAADLETDQLGGRPSSRLDVQVREVADLLVALADEAVEHQAALASDDPVPATLAEARDRLAASRVAYDELSTQHDRRRSASGEAT